MVPAEELPTAEAAAEAPAGSAEAAVSSATAAESVASQQQREQTAAAEAAAAAQLAAPEQQRQQEQGAAAAAAAAAAKRAAKEQQQQEEAAAAAAKRAAQEREQQQQQQKVAAVAAEVQQRLQQRHHEAEAAAAAAAAAATAAAAHGDSGASSSSSSVGHSADCPHHCHHHQQQQLSWTPVEPPLMKAFGNITNMANDHDEELDIDEALAVIKQSTVGWRFHANNPLGWWCCMFEWLVYCLLATSLRVYSWTLGTPGPGSGMCGGFAHSNQLNPACVYQNTINIQRKCHVILSTGHHDIHLLLDATHAAYRRQAVVGCNTCITHGPGVWGFRAHVRAREARWRTRGLRRGYTRSHLGCRGRGWSGTPFPSMVISHAVM